MRQTVIHIPSFEGPYKTGLVFSMIEALKMGEAIKIICDHNVAELETLLKEANVPTVQWAVQQDPLGRWELNIIKEDPFENAEVGCCGMCGGNGHGKS